MDRSGEYQTVSAEVLELDLSVFFESVSKQKEQYQEQLLRLYEKIISHNPDTLYFLDRSARPVYWMLKSLSDSLGRKLPQVKFMSLERDGELNPRDIEHFLRSTNVSKSESIVVIDEFESQGFNREKVDELARHFNLNNVVYIPFMNKKIGHRSPAFYNATDGVKEYLYGILDSTKDSLVSQASTISRPERIKHRQAYRSIFTDIGKQAAIQYRINHPEYSDPGSEEFR